MILDSLIEQKKLLKDDFDDFEKRLVANPEDEEVIPGARGLRKTRLKSSFRGKSGGFRICYLDIPEKEILFLLVIFPKNVQEDLSQEEIKILKAFVEKLKKE